MPSSWLFGANKPAFLPQDFPKEWLAHYSQADPDPHRALRAINVSIVVGHTFSFNGSDILGHLYDQTNKTYQYVPWNFRLSATYRISVAWCCHFDTSWPLCWDCENLEAQDLEDSAKEAEKWRQMARTCGWGTLWIYSLWDCIPELARLILLNKCSIELERCSTPFHATLCAYCCEAVEIIWILKIPTTVVEY